MTDTVHHPPFARAKLGALAIHALGLALSGAFYAVVVAVPSPLLHRYFLGHPIAIATTVLFCMAAAQLAARHWRILRARAQISWISDQELVPEPLHELARVATSSDLDPASPAPARRPSDANAPSDAPTGNSADATSATHLPAVVALSGTETMTAATPLSERLACWLDHLQSLPAFAAGSPLVQRMTEILQRQQRAGSGEHLNADLQLLADRDADQDHDSLQLVRIIIWAIPMLGFLGTVVGITQTLGGLDFTDGPEAVERLKSGLYVAFDTTALGLVLSVVAIFLQFPVEKSSRQLLDQVDDRVARLVPPALVAPAAADDRNPLVALHHMTQEISRSVQQSVRMQAELWRQTIDSAHGHWQQSASDASDQLQSALQATLGDSLTATLRDHAESLRRVQSEGADAIDNRWQQWQTALSDNARVLVAHQKALLGQTELLAQTNTRARELERLQSTLEANVRSLDKSLQSVDLALQGVAGAASMADAMMILARAVDVLASRIPATDASGTADPHHAGDASAARQAHPHGADQRTKPRRNAA